MSIKQIFEGCRVVGLAGEKSSGKTNSIVYLIKQLPYEKRQKIYFYGMPLSVAHYLKTIGCNEMDSINQMIGKTGCLFILEEFQKLNLNDRRYREQLNLVIDFVYHNKNLILFSSPNIREFNSVIGGVIEKWLLKTVLLSSCINGSQLKRVVEEYKGSYKQMYSIVTPKDEMILINNDCSVVIKSNYVEEADSKSNDGVKDFSEIVRKLSERLSEMRK